MTLVHFIQPDGTRQTVTAKDDLSLMEAARQNNVDGIVADCGGGALCSTCHVYVSAEWMDVVGPPSPTEEMMLDIAPGRGEGSRLSCQINVTPELDGLVVRVPDEQAI